MANELYIAVDLGAGSGRVFLAGVEPEEFFLEEIHRFQYPPTQENGHLRWNFKLIFEEIKKGLCQAAKKARELKRPIYSIGVDSWAVDYGLLDANKNLLANPVCYRDHRTIGAMEKVFKRISRDQIFEKTGIQFLNFNTIYQLFSENGTFKKADKVLLLPDLINFYLTGQIATEYTNATTTQMFNAADGNWDLELLEKIKVPPQILPQIVQAGTNLGFLKKEIADELNLKNVRVIAPATHDTASAVAGAPLKKNWAYISSGTWSLVGIERDEVLITSNAALENFTNEGGAFGTIRFLKNVMGLWIFESCRKEWKRRGIETDYETLLGEVEQIDGFKGVIFPDDKRFLNPPDMLGAIAAQMRETGQLFDGNPAVVSKIIFDSLAFRYASVMKKIEHLTAEKIIGVQILGGGGRNDYLNQMTANVGNLTVQAGLYEATVTGNVLVQAIAAGRFAELSDARQHVAENVRLKEYKPIISSDLDKAAKLYAEVESKFVQ